MVRPGGTGFDLDEERRTTFLTRLDAALRDVTVAVELLWSSTSVMARFEDTGGFGFRHQAPDLFIGDAVLGLCPISEGP